MPSHMARRKIILQDIFAFCFLFIDSISFNILLPQHFSMYIAKAKPTKPCMFAGK
jgi:hypothetical protein